MKFRLRAPSPALVVALIALFIALGGTSYAAITSLPKNSVGTKQLKKNAVTGVKIKNGAVTAAKINTAGLTVPNATTAGNANQLGGKAPSAYASSTLEAAHVVGAAGQPAFQNGWGVPGFAGDEAASFYKDPWGIVHLQGNVARSGGATTGAMFTLPTGYRPAKSLFFAAYGNGSTIAFVDVQADGTVNAFNSQSYVGLGTITFRAGL
jgi:hypothetical protein